MKLSAAIISAAALGSTASAAAVAAQPPTFKVQTYHDTSCSKPADIVTLKYNSNTGCGDCQTTGGFKSYRVLGKPPQKFEDFNFLIASAFFDPGPAPCLSSTYVNASTTDLRRPCTKAVDVIKGKEYPVYELKLEFSGP